MDPFSSNMPLKRETSKKSNQAEKEDEKVYLQEDDEDNTQEELKCRVHDSIHELIRMGYDFEMILKGSKVNRSFLEQAFQELRYCKQKHDLEIITSDEDSDGKLVTPEGRKRMQVEVKLFMMRVQLEINKLSAFLDQADIEERLQDDSIKRQLEGKREMLIKNMNDLFDKVTKKGDEIETQRKRKNAYSEDEGAAKYSKGSSSSEADGSSPGVLVDSGFVKISKSEVEGFKPYHSVVSYDNSG